jgi:hypothetical protein
MGEGGEERKYHRGVTTTTKDFTAEAQWRGACAEKNQSS